MKNIIVKGYDISKPKELTNYQNDPPAFKCIDKVKYK
jgi:hypothetical protein